MIPLADPAADPDAGCEWWDLACVVGDGVSTVISQGANDALQEFVNNTLEGTFTHSVPRAAIALP